MQRAQDGVSRLRCCAIAYLTVHHGEPEADPKPTSAIVIRRLTATLNHAYYATPDPFLDDVLKSPVSGFLNDHYNPGSTATFAVNGAIVPAPGNRNVQLGGEIRF
jgi:hypothetical protein